MNVINPFIHSAETYPVLTTLMEPSVEWGWGETDKKVALVATRPSTLGGSRCYREKLSKEAARDSGRCGLKHGGQGQSRRGETAEGGEEVSPSAPGSGGGSDGQSTGRGGERRGGRAAGLSAEERLPTLALLLGMDRRGANVENGTSTEQGRGSRGRNPLPNELPPTGGLTGTAVHSLRALETGRLAPSGGSEGPPAACVSPSSRWPPAPPGVPWLVDASLQPSLHPHVASPLVKTLVTGFRARANPGRSHLESLNCISKHPFSK